MKSALLYLVACSLGMLLAGCDIGKPVDPADVPTSQLTFSLSMKGAPSNVARIEAALARYGYDTLRTELTILGDSAAGELLAVPIGTWKVTVGAFDAGNELLFEGSNYVNVQGGAVNVVEVTLEPVSGTVTIVAWWPTGKAGSALHLDGNGDYAEILESESLSSTDSALTVEAWVRPQCSYYNTVVSKASMAYFVQILSCSALSLLAYGVNIDYTGAYEYWGRLVVNHEFPEGRWSHVAMTFNASTGFKLYANGALLHTAASSGAIDASPGAFRVGARQDELYTEYFTGDIDEVRIWNIERSESDISTWMRKELTGTEEGLVGYWKFNEEAGATVAMDSSPLGNNLQLHGNATLVPSGAF